MQLTYIKKKQKNKQTDNSIVTVAIISLSIHFHLFHSLTEKMTNRTRTTPAPTTISIIHVSSRILERTNQSFNTHGKHIHLFSSLYGYKNKENTTTTASTTDTTHHSRIPVLTNQSFYTHNKHIYLFYPFTDEIKKENREITTSHNH